MNHLLIDEARIIIESVAIALERVKDPRDIDAIRQLLKEADALLSLALRI